MQDFMKRKVDTGNKMWNTGGDPDTQYVHVCSNYYATTKSHIQSSLRQY